MGYPRHPICAYRDLLICESEGRSQVVNNVDDFEVDFSMNPLTCTITVHTEARMRPHVLELSFSTGREQKAALQLEL